jgi:uncharacterized protein YggE
MKNSNKETDFDSTSNQGEREGAKARSKTRRIQIASSRLPSRHRVFALAFILLFTQQATAADDGISVEGIATVKAKPTEVLIAGSISGEGELANDASVKYHDSKKKALAAIDALKNPDLSVKSDGPEVHEAVDPAQQQRIMQGQGAGETPKVRVNISERLELTLKNADKLENDKLLETVLKLIDASRDAGIIIGPPPATNYYQMQMQAQNGGADSLVQYKIPDTTDLRNQATKQAIDDARAKAQQIADLSGVKLGKVLSVHDEATAPVQQQQTWNPWMGMMTGGGDEDHTSDKEATSTSFGEIPVTVRLQVQFEIEKP